MKMIKINIRLFLLIVVSSLAYFSVAAQKVKYKDLIVLLTSKQYEKAEPFLKRYIKENDDNPNAFLFMGIVFQEKSSKMDPLLNTEVLCLNLDSSALYYDKAYKAITEKELRKNDEYYEAYMRRDLRTGKFVIKLSDVQLDIENRIRSLKERKERVKLLKIYFEEASNKYAKANSIYKSLQTNYGTEKQFYLRSDDGMVNQLKHLSLAFDSSTVAFDKYKTISKELGKTGYSQIIDLQEIKDIKRDGSAAADFLKDDLKLWNYKQWADQSIDVIEKEINPMRNHLVTFDIELNKLREKLKSDSSSIKKDLVISVDKQLSERLKKYDPNPMPLELFIMKIAELKYHYNMILNRPLRDSSNVKLKLNAIRSEISDLITLDSIATILGQRNYEDEDKNYHHFISKVFGTTTVLKSTVSTTQEFAKRERLKKDKEWEETSQLLKWIVSSPDSIPLFTEFNRDLPFKPLGIEEEKYTFGLKYTDSLATGYFYSITPSRLPELKASFKVDQPNFKKRNFSLFKGLSTGDNGGNVFVLLVYSSQKANNKFPGSLAKIYRSDGLAWNVDIGFEFLPSEISINSDNGEIAIKITGGNGESKIVIVDKNGKMKN